MPKVQPKSMTIDTDTQTFEISGFVNPTVKYEYKDDVITANITGSERQYFKKVVRLIRKNSRSLT